MAPPGRGTDIYAQVFSEKELRERAIAFDRVDRRELIVPNLAQATFDLIILTDRELHGAVITGVGLDSPQWDFFNNAVDYLFTIQRVQPVGQILKVQDGNLLTSELQYMSFRGVGSTENPTGCYIVLKQKYVWSIVIKGRAGVPATGFRVANLFIRTKGYQFR